MPLVSISIQKQLQAAATSIRLFPQTPNIINKWRFGDQFNRETLNPTNAVAIYTTAATNSGTATITSVAEELSLTTDTATSDDVHVRTSESAFERVPIDLIYDDRSSIVLDITFNVNATTSTEGFIGFLRGVSAITAIPTTARHVGLNWDRSASANYFFTSANGTDQVTTDTGFVIKNTNARIRAIWTGNDTATIEYYVDDNSQSPDASESVTALGMENNNYELCLFIQTETTAARSLRVKEWQVIIN